MSDTSGIRYSLEVGSHELSLEPIDAENYAIIVNGDYEAAFSGFRSAHRVLLARIDDNRRFSEDEKSIIGDIANWRKDLIDLFDPEEDRE